MYSKMNTCDVPEEQSMTSKDIKSKSIFSEKAVAHSAFNVLQTKLTAKKYEPRTVLEQLENDPVISSLKEVLRTLASKDGIEYCLDCSNDVLLTKTGFVFRTESVRKSHQCFINRWAFSSSSRVGDQDVVFAEIKQAIEELAKTTDIESKKLRLGANLYLRDFVPQSLVFDKNFCNSYDCPVSELCCLISPCCWPCSGMTNLVSCILGREYGTKYDDKRPAKY